LRIDWSDHFAILIFMRREASRFLSPGDRAALAAVARAALPAG
jgi:hypothetical protein